MAVGVILQSFVLALSQAGDRRFRRVLFLGIVLTFALLVAAYAGLLVLLQWLVGDSATLPLIGEVTWVGELVTWSSFFAMMALSVFLMVPVASAITSLFLDDVAQAVEDRHYPHLPAVPRLPIPEQIKDSLGFLGVLIGANIVALALYVLFPPFALFIFWGLNGFLLGREYYTLAAIRRVGREEANRLRGRNWLSIWAAGVLMAVPLSVPLVNLVIPIFGAATFTHIFHRLNGGLKRA
ncbi:EI24 domain-containing protein [Pseudooceanicola nanhaiensis]|uniref:EI24 domain-containing protein n=1 Tax=Pseudooceanicola nanhaiensis TaxID=375761 RepID=UPI001CD7E281|nr:EI24 domain-containing protein [Pseudooceanicola nanhaiensis]MCA0921863.1 EI24 domain-containing protein [Pseudooceanicola nanhaiensis]